MHDKRQSGPTRSQRTPGGAGEPSSPADARLDRRALILAGLGLMLTGCTSTSSSRPLLGSSLPDVPWDAGSGAGGGPATVAEARPTILPGTPASSGSFNVSVAGLQPRAAWGAGAARTTSINPMLPIKWITIHHDGMAYRGRTRSAARSRMQMIQSSHQNHRRWADIGYHFVVDRQGLVWQGRELRWQGAHVGGSNEGNVGIMLMGNFQEQRPTSEQVASLQRMVVALQRRFAVPVSQVRTHLEWPTAATECPGLMLQAQVDQLRRRRQFA